ncbi:Rhomboid protein 1, mitochondrial [Smittium culicis]|uniref:Rhomboid protein 1, mitochondrial n=1 Tax=Smittium culicis TaxID=133412 RepID=A0A1R1YRJ3_9FUNG|nr:Rhomboid protein 1, mitochondrial [Smittium culicis]
MAISFFKLSGVSINLKKIATITRGQLIHTKFNLTAKPIQKLPNIKTVSLDLSQFKLQGTSKQLYSRWESHSKVDYGVRGKWSDGSRGGNYQRGSYKRFNFTPKGVVYSIIGINVGVFGAWMYAEGQQKSFNNSKLFAWMYKNFTLSIYNLKEGRLWTMLTSEFSHMNLTHLLVNSLVLYSLGPQEQTKLTTRMLHLSEVQVGHYNLINSIVYLLFYDLLFPLAEAYCAGNATIVLFASLFPKTTFLLFFIVPCPAWLAAGGFIAYDVYNSISRGNPIIDSFAHLGGAGIGFGYYWFKLRPFLRRF